jgi:hypothetical protein
LVSCDLETWTHTKFPFPTMEQKETAEPRPARRRQSSRRMSEESYTPRFVRRHSTSSSHAITARQRRNSHDIAFNDDTGVMSLSESSWWNESPLLVAVLPCLGAFLFGTEYIQDIILFVCVCWYLHTCIHCMSLRLLNSIVQTTDFLVGLPFLT